MREDKELYCVVSINEIKKSVLIESLDFGNKLEITNNDSFYRFARNQITLEEEFGEPLFFTAELDTEKRIINYGKS